MGNMKSCCYCRNDETCQPQPIYQGSMKSRSKRTWGRKVKYVWSEGKKRRHTTKENIGEELLKTIVTQRENRIRRETSAPSILVN